MSDNSKSDRSGAKAAKPERTSELERLLEETRERLDKSRIFLSQLPESDGTSRKYIEELMRRLRDRLLTLQSSLGDRHGN